MTKQEEIREGLARRMFDSQMSADQCYGVAIREKAWEDEKEEWLARAYNDLCWLHSQGVVLKVGEIREIPRAAADPEAYSADKLGVSWERSAPVFREFKDAGYVAVEPLIEVTIP